ncbi:MAG: hypothetical protein AAB456_00580 [Patescibacteria group bacterium]
MKHAKKTYTSAASRAAALLGSIGRGECKRRSPEHYKNIGKMGGTAKARNKKMLNIAIMADLRLPPIKIKNLEKIPTEIIYPGAITNPLQDKSE